jgi:hypothetical protein
MSQSSSQPPSQTVTIRDIPADRVDALAKDHKEMGADKIEVIKHLDGNFSLKVTYSSSAS